MKFESIHQGIDCNCIVGLTQDITNLYVRVVNKPRISERDLKSHWEKGREATGSCEEDCAWRGLSINRWENDTMKHVIEKSLLTFGITPMKKNSLYIFKFKENAGVIKHSPTNKDAYHYTFFKCDGFTSDMLEEIEVKELRGYINT